MTGFLNDLIVASNVCLLGGFALMLSGIDGPPVTTAELLGVPIVGMILWMGRLSVQLDAEMRAAEAGAA